MPLSPEMAEMRARMQSVSFDTSTPASSTPTAGFSFGPTRSSLFLAELPLKEAETKALQKVLLVSFCPLLFGLLECVYVVSVGKGLFL